MLMTIFSIVMALMLEQFQPLPQQRYVREPLARYARWLEGHFNDGQVHHGAIAWLIALFPITLLVVVLQVLLGQYQPLLALMLNIGVLYLTMGFRQFSHFFTDIHLALRTGDIDRARTLLGEWRGRGVEQLGAQEIARLSIEEALLASHHHVFAPLFCFMFLGPAGAVLYRLALFFKGQWGEEDVGGFGKVAGRFFSLIDWLPLRCTAGIFAMVGDFEDAVFCWRTQARHWQDPDSGILLSSGAGAIGVRLGQPIQDINSIQSRPELGVGEEADADFMQSTIGLVWRGLVLCLLLLALFWVASWVG